MTTYVHINSGRVREFSDADIGKLKLPKVERYYIEIPNPDDIMNSKKVMWAIHVSNPKKRHPVTSKWIKSKYPKVRDKFVLAEGDKTGPFETNVPISEAIEEKVERNEVMTPAEPTPTKEEILQDLQNEASDITEGLEGMNARSMVDFIEGLDNRDHLQEIMRWEESHQDRKTVTKAIAKRIKQL